MNLRWRMGNNHGLVLAQCNTALQAYGKGLESYEENTALFNIIWLLTESKKSASGIDSKANEIGKTYMAPLLHFTR